jgi:hypothetical protein
MDIIKWGTLRYLSFDIYMFNLLCKRDAVLSASAERESIIPLCYSSPSTNFCSLLEMLINAFSFLKKVVEECV